MNTMDRLAQAGLFTRTAPRYTSYPAANVFHAGVGPTEFTGWLAESDPAAPLSLYLHIPFCERLCWFCACRTQGTRTHAPVAAYLDSLMAEVALVTALMPGRRRVARLHWGGGTPTILTPDQITRLAEALRAAFDLSDTEFSVEIDPTCVDEARLDALVAAGMTRASLGVQDFSPAVQAAIGRDQSFADTARLVEALRTRGIEAINTDLVYGLPEQSPERFDDTLAKLLQLAPSRVALFGYAHVPWMAQRQRMIRDDALPDPRARHALFTAGTGSLREGGFEAVGIDHFALPGDTLAVAAREGRLRRNFQGYTDDPCDILLGLGASSISRFPQGYVQNAPGTAAYQDRVRKGLVATSRGFAFTTDDRLRGRAIEMLMCDFRIDLSALQAIAGDAAARLAKTFRDCLAQFPGAITSTAGSFAINPDFRPLTRLIAAAFDGYAHDGLRQSPAS